MYVPTIRLCMPFVLARRAEAILTASGALCACGRTSMAARGPRWSRPTHSPVLGRGPRASASERQARASTVLEGRTPCLCIQLPLLVLRPLSLCQQSLGRIRGCASAVSPHCNMIELLHAKLTHTYAATRRPSGTHVGRAAVSLSVFQICLSLLKKGIPPKTCNSGRLHNLRRSS